MSEEFRAEHSISSIQFLSFLFTVMSYSAAMEVRLNCESRGPILRKIGNRSKPFSKPLQNIQPVNS